MASSSAGTKTPAKLRPSASASVILVSPSNQILLLHRVQTSSSFPSAHVFPGGSISIEHDGELPTEDDPCRHQDGPVYRCAAIRECFEESGILLAKQAVSAGAPLLMVDNEERERARKDVHTNRLNFADWVQSKGGVLDTDGLVPFARIFTPLGMPRRFSTQMYLYFLPLTGPRPSTPSSELNDGLAREEVEVTIPVPTTDGGIEHNAALFLPADEWLRLAGRREIILFPPQYILLHILAQFLSSGPQEDEGTNGLDELQSRREQVLEFVKTGNPPWGEKYIYPSPKKMVDERVKKMAGGKILYELSAPVPDLPAFGGRGDEERLFFLKWEKGVPRDIEVRWRSEVFAGAVEGKEKL